MIEINASSHGRVNLIGEYRDYNGGCVLQTLIPQTTSVHVTIRADQEVHASTDANHINGSSVLSYKLGEETPTGHWIDYLQGATHILSELNFQLSGFDINIESTIPTSGGLSSSAALEVSFLKSLREAFQLNLSDFEIAEIGQRIDKEFVGSSIGSADQMACSLARSGEALFLDTLKMSYEHIPLPNDLMDLVVINSGITTQKTTGDGNRRRAECEDVSALLGIQSLRELKISDLEKLKPLPSNLLKRARHVVTENERVNLAVQALKSKNVKQLGELFYASHLSMKDDFEVSIPEVDFLVELCMAERVTYGARLTGGGFGGSVVALTEKGKGREMAQLVVEAYQNKAANLATILVS